MKVDFKQDSQLDDDEINVLVSAKELTPEVIELLSMLQNVSIQNDNYIPINTNDRVQIISVDDIVGIEIFENELNIYTTSEHFVTTGTLKEMYEKLKKHHFVQISKSAIINIDHLNYMETAFSGNMTLFLSNDIKLHASRKYLPGLKKSLRMWTAMNLFRNLLKRFFFGMMFGSLIYVVTGLYSRSYGMSDRMVFLLASGLIGLVSIVFKSEKIGFVFQLAIHGILTYIIIIALNRLITPDLDFWNPYVFSVFTIEFILIYAITCTISMVIFHRSTKEINNEIMNRKKQKNK